MPTPYLTLLFHLLIPVVCYLVSRRAHVQVPDKTWYYSGPRVPTDFSNYIISLKMKNNFSKHGS